MFKGYKKKGSQGEISPFGINAKYRERGQKELAAGQPVT